MMFKATKFIKEEMDRQGLIYSVQDFEECSILSAAFKIENGPQVRVQFISRSDDNDVAIRAYGIVNSVAENKIDKMMGVLNECNCKYRYLKFNLDQDYDVDIEYDMLLRTCDSTLGAEACEVFIRIMDVANEVYPELMRVIWN